MTTQRIGILGGTGFVGRHLVAALTSRGIATRVLTRRRSRARHLLVFPTCEVVETDIHDALKLRAGLAGCSAAINLVGILNTQGGETGSFQLVHAELPGKLSQACEHNRIPRVLHMGALNAGTEAPSEYLKSKGRGEDAAHAASDEGVAVTSFRPSVIFGPGDAFFNRFAMFLAMTPLVFPLACPGARFAPVYVENVVRAFINSLEDKATFGQRYNLCGPREYTLKALVEYAAEVSGHRRVVLGLGAGLSRLQAACLERVPGKPFSRDNLLSMQVDSVCAGDDLARLGIRPTGIESIVPTYLGTRERNRFYNNLRCTAGR